MSEINQNIDYIREDLKQIRTEFMEERKLLIEAEHRSVASFDKAMMTLSAGALGFSITFVRILALDPSTSWQKFEVSWS